MLANYSSYTNAIINNATFANSPLLGGNTRSAYYLLLLGSIVAIVSLVTSVPSCYRFLTLAHLLCLTQGGDQAYLGLLPLHFLRCCGKHIRACRFSPLDSHHQEG